MVSVSNSVDWTQIKQFAAAGHFRAIALWVNEPLIARDIYAHVQAGSQPGCLRILLEFKRLPKKEPIIRLVCSRLWQLNSPIIEGLEIVARYIGQNQSQWQRRIRIPLPHQRRQRATAVKPATAHPQPASAHPTHFAESLTAKTSTSKPSKRHPHRVRQQPQAVATQTTAAQSPMGQSGSEPLSLNPVSVVKPRNLAVTRPQASKKPLSHRHPSRRRRAIHRSRELLDQQFKFIRATVITGSAAAAFILGCLTEVMIFEAGPSLPQWGTPAAPSSDWGQVTPPTATEVAFQPQNATNDFSDSPVETQQPRSNRIDAALEPVAVISHDQVNDPTDPTVTLMFGGEVALGSFDRVSPTEADAVLSHLQAYQQADIAMVNLGNSLATAGTSLQEDYYQRTRPEAVAALKEGGIDLVGLTSEHNLDYGERGLLETLKTLDQEGISRIGAGRDQREARRPEILDVKGQRIAYLAYTPSGAKAATVDKAGINAADRQTIVEDITAIRHEVDWVVVNYRWLNEQLTTQPDPQQVSLSRAAIDAGADLVVGYHPYQLQGAEVYKNRPIIYALGDFIFQDAPLDDHDTAALRVALRQGQMKVEFLPVSVRQAKPQAATGEHGEAILQQIRQASASLSSPLNFPVILDAKANRPSPSAVPTTVDRSKPPAPVKSLGEIEPASVSEPTTEAAPSPAEAYQWQMPEENSTFVPQPAEQNGTLTPAREEDAYHQSDTFETPASQDDAYYQPDAFETPASQDDESLDPESPSYVPSGDYPTDYQGEQAEQWPADAVQSPTPDFVAPYSDGAEESVSPVPAASPEGTNLDQNSLEEWGQKASPHGEFQPIPEHQFTEPTGEPTTTEGFGEEASLKKNIINGAIEPYSEPLVGPLSELPQPQ